MGSQSKTLLPRDMEIVGGDESRYWNWVLVEGQSPNKPEDAAELNEIHFLEVKAKFDTKTLPSGTKYEVVFVIMIKSNAGGWKNPVKLGLISPDKVRKEREENFTAIAVRYEWKEIPVAEISAPSEEEKKGITEIEIYLRGSEDSESKKGIIIKSVIIRPKELCYPSIFISIC